LDQFWEACQGPGELRLLIEQAGLPPRGVVLSTPFAVIGRDDPSDIALDDDAISRRHLYLQVLNGRLWCFDLVSRSGVFWDDLPQQSGWMGGTGVRIGPFHVQALSRELLEPCESNPLSSHDEDADAGPAVRLEFLNAAMLGAFGERPLWHIDRSLTLIGQSQHCKIRFKCPSVSRIHCSLVRTPQGIWVIDLLGRERLQVNGMQVRWARLLDGDRLKVGRFEMDVHIEAPQAAEAPAAAEPPAPAEPAPLASSALVSDPSRGMSAANPAGIAGLDLFASFMMGNAPASPGSTAIAPARPPQQPLSLPTPGPGLDPTQTLLMTFANQFSMMQQQMFDQFQQTTLMMLQMVGTLHRDQFEFVRQELAGLRELNQQIQDIQAKLDRHKPAAAPSPAPRPATASAPPAPRPAAPTPAKPAASAPAAAAPATNGNHTKPAPPKDKAPPAAATAPAGEAAPNGDDVHGWLAQRFSELQQERQTRWQKLVATLMGK
jgi:pSer/pThr/pTyr-binding forkhead associated (FHA) protein